MTEGIKNSPVKGYSDQESFVVEQVNVNKVLEETVLRRLDELCALNNPDQRCLAVARTGIEEAFMWMNRGLFKPQRIDLPRDRDFPGQG